MRFQISQHEFIDTRYIVRCSRRTFNVDWHEIRVSLADGTNFTLKLEHWDDCDKVFKQLMTEKDTCDIPASPSPSS